MTLGLGPRLGTVVHTRVRTSGGVCDARRRAGAAIGGADLRASSLPPSAILCVRQIEVPVAIGSPDDVADRRDFDRALQTRLDELARRAKRPAIDSVGWCDAVLFDDEAELLACLARDWLAGRAGDRWWWRALVRERIGLGLVRERMGLGLVVKAWTDAPPMIAPAIERLAEWRQAAAFVSALEHGHVQRLTMAMMQAHGGPAAADLLAIRGATTAVPAAFDRPAASGLLEMAAAVAPLASRYAAAETRTPPRRDQRALLALAAVVQHPVPLLRRAGFAEVFQAALSTPVDAGWVSPRFNGPSARSDVLLERPDHREPEVASRGEPSPGLTPPRAEVRSPGVVPLQAPPRTTASSRVVDDVRSTASEAAPDVINPGLPSLPRAEPPPLGPPVDTPVGGLFYVLNVAIALNFYGDFTMPRRRGLPFSPWDFLALVAERWGGEPLQDATARLLARLGGRSPDERPGERAMPADRLARLVPRLVWRVNRWIAAAVGEPAEVNLARRVLCHQARVHVTAAHVDVVFDLASLPIEIRLAGLDRDPGWMAAAGRIVRFHYS